MLEARALPGTDLENKSGKSQHSLTTQDGRRNTCSEVGDRLLLASKLDTGEASIEAS